MIDNNQITKLADSLYSAYVMARKFAGGVLNQLYVECMEQSVDFQEGFKEGIEMLALYLEKHKIDTNIKSD